MTKEDYQELNNTRPRVINVNTFERYWSKFHTINPQLKVNKTATKKLFDKCNCEGRKRKLIQGIEKTKLSCYEYIKLKL